MLGKGGNDQDIVSMVDRDRARKTAPLRTVETYWHALCGENTVPLRSEVDPRGMENALEYAFLLERIAPTMAKIRVAGSHLSDLMGMQVAGMPLSTLIAPEDRETFGQGVSRLFADPGIVRIELIGQDGFGKPAMKGWMILMPLRSDFGEVSRALGALVTDGRIGRTPRRFRVGRVSVEPALKTQGTATPAATTPTEVPATPAAPIQRRPLPASGPLSDPLTEITRPAARASSGEGDRPSAPARGHLRLVVSND